MRSNILHQLDKKVTKSYTCEHCVKVPPPITDRVVNFTSDADALAGSRPSGALYGAAFYLCDLAADISAILLRTASLDDAYFPSQTLRW